MKMAAHTKAPAIPCAAPDLSQAEFVWLMSVEFGRGVVSKLDSVVESNMPAAVVLLSWNGLVVQFESMLKSSYSCKNTQQHREKKFKP